MDNSTRAARLAEMGFFHIESRMAHSLSSGDGLLDGDILLSLLTELPKRGYGYRLENMNAETVRAKVCHEDSVLVIHRAEASDPLLALVDAFIAACGKEEEDANPS